MERIYVYVPGILTWPGSARNWSGRAVTATMADPKSPYRAEKVEYFCGPVGRALGQRKRAAKLYQTLEYYDHYGHRVLVGHSNGADVILTMLRDYPAFLTVEALHLVCGATGADFRQNGLNRLLEAKRVGHVFVYVAGRDAALRLASWRLARWLGYGTLGLHGARQVAASVRHRVTEVRGGAWENYGHSDCWADENFEGTMERFLRP